MQHSVARYQATKRRPSRSCFSIPPRSIDVLGRLLTTTLDTIYHFRRSPPFPGLSGLDMPSLAARTRSGATTAWRFSLSFFVFGSNTCGSPSGAVFFSLIHILGHGSSAFRALFVFLRSFVLMFIPFSTSNAKHCRLGASDTSIPPSHDETGFFFLFFFSYHNFHPPVFFFFCRLPLMNDSEYAPDGWTTTTIRMGKRCTALGEEMSGYGGRVLELMGWVYIAHPKDQVVAGREKPGRRRYARRRNLEKNLLQGEEALGFVGWSTPAGRGGVVWKTGGVAWSDGRVVGDRQTRARDRKSSYVSLPRPESIPAPEGPGP